MLYQLSYAGDRKETIERTRSTRLQERVYPTPKSPMVGIRLPDDALSSRRRHQETLAIRRNVPEQHAGGHFE